MCRWCGLFIAVDIFVGYFIIFRRCAVAVTAMEILSDKMLADMSLIIIFFSAFRVCQERRMNETIEIIFIALEMFQAVKNMTSGETLERATFFLSVNSIIIIT